MTKYTTKKKTHSNTKSLWTAMGIAAVVVAIAIVGAAMFNMWPFAKTATQPTSAVKKPSSRTGVPDRAPQANVNNAATDTAGSTIPAQTPDSATWSKSKDGSSIVVMSPAPGSLLTSGDMVYGTAASGPVSYELEDNVSGIILQGQAKVVDNKFSIKLNFSTTGTKGKVNVFNQASDGTESNHVSVDVRFK